jgi:hypothetical protein
MAPGKNTKPVMVRMPPELYERVKLAADQTMSNPAVICRILIKQALNGWTLPGDEDYEGVVMTAPPADPEPDPGPGLSRQERRRLERENRRK